MLGVILSCSPGTSSCGKGLVEQKVKIETFDKVPAFMPSSIVGNSRRSTRHLNKIVDSEFINEIRAMTKTESSAYEAPTGIEDYDPANPRYIQQVSPDEASALQEKLLQKQIAALQRVIASHRGSGARSEVLKHYEQVSKALTKEVELLSREDCISLPSTASPESDSSEALLRFSRDNTESWCEEMTPRVVAEARFSRGPHTPTEADVDFCCILSTPRRRTTNLVPSIIVDSSPIDTKPQKFWV